MADSTTNKNRTGEAGRSGPHFFKIIIQEAIRDGKLFIPRKFLRKYGKNLKNRVILKDPTGTEWPVELTHSEGELWLDKGFPEFAKFYSLSHGYLVVFQLQIRDDADCFSVVVFDPTATEINYPPNPVQQQVPRINQEDSTGGSESDHDQDLRIDSGSDDHDVQGGGESSSLETRKRSRVLPKQSSELEDPPSPKVRRTNSCSDVGGSKSKTCSSSSSSEVGASAAPGMNIDPSRRTLSNEEKKEAIDRARSAFTSTDPFFMLPVQPSYLIPLPNVGIPMSFAKQHLKNGTAEAILVRVSDGREWKVKYTVCCEPGRAKKMKAWFSGSGWKDFAQGNQLAVGDVCAFQLTSTITSTVSFGVTIFRNYKQPWTWTPT